MSVYHREQLAQERNVFRLRREGALRPLLRLQLPAEPLAYHVASVHSSPGREESNLRNLKSVIVQITDRGPHRRNRLIDLSEAAARELKFRKRGLAKVRIEEVPAGIDLRALDLLYPQLPGLDTEGLRIKVPMRIGY